MIGTSSAGACVMDVAPIDDDAGALRPSTVVVAGGSSVSEDSVVVNMLLPGVYSLTSEKLSTGDVTSFAIPSRVKSSI